MQEMYLPDGDLYSDGGGRVRRFRWKNIGKLDPTINKYWFYTHLTYNVTALCGVILTFFYF